MSSSSTHRHRRFYRLPLEVQLEVFGSLTLGEWMGLARHNRRTKRVLLSNRRYLAPLARLEELEIKQRTPSSHAGARRKDITWAAYSRFSSLLVGEDDGVVLSEQLAKIRAGQLPLFSRVRNGGADCWLTVRPTSVPSFRRFSIWLPVLPKTADELRLIRFWLHVLMLASFETIDAYSVFCPEFLAVLFPPSPGNLLRPLLRCSRMKLYNFGAPLPATLGPLICARYVEINLHRDEGAQDWDELFQMLCSTWTVPKRFDVLHTGRSVPELQYMIEVAL